MRKKRRKVGNKEGHEAEGVRVTGIGGGLRGEEVRNLSISDGKDKIEWKEEERVRRSQ